MAINNIKPPLTMSENKRYTAEESLNLQSAAYQKGYNEGYQLGKTEHSPSAVWREGKETYPIEDGQYYIRRGDIKSVANLWQSTKEYWQTTDMEWLDESGTGAGREEYAVEFAEWIRETYQPDEFGYWIDHAGNQYTTSDRYVIFKQQNRNNENG